MYLLQRARLREPDKFVEKVNYRSMKSMSMDEEEEEDGERRQLEGLEEARHADRI